MNEVEMISSFERGELDPSQFDHRAHLRLTWAYLRRQPLPEVMIKMRDGLKSFTEKLGVPEKYNETITFTFILLMHQRLLALGPATDFDSFIHEEKELSLHWQQRLHAWYRPETLYSTAARERYLLPDHLALEPGESAEPGSR